MAPRTTTTLHVAGISAPVEVTRKRQKNMYVRVKAPDARVVVTAPTRFDDALIRQFLEQKAAWIETQRSRIIKGRSEGGSEKPGAPTPEELAQWRAIVAAFAPALVERWAPIMGVKPGALVYRNMVSRWGSCNVKTGRICLNVQLAAHPPECLEYVVVHELCHLLEPSHGPRFKALMTRFLPDWREREAKLRGGIRR